MTLKSMQREIEDTTRNIERAKRMLVIGLTILACAVASFITLLIIRSGTS